MTLEQRIEVEALEKHLMNIKKNRKKKRQRKNENHSAILIVNGSVIFS